MSAENNTALEEKTPQVSPGNYSPVTVYMKDTIGALFLGILTIVVLIGWRISEEKYRTLLTRQEAIDGRRSSDAG